jgi:hypothetical protein
MTRSYAVDNRISSQPKSKPGASLHSGPISAHSSFQLLSSTIDCSGLRGAIQWKVYDVISTRHTIAGHNRGAPLTIPRSNAREIVMTGKVGFAGAGAMGRPMGLKPRQGRVRGDRPRHQVKVSDGDGGLSATFSLTE